jgi:hypothetical protein
MKTTWHWHKNCYEDKWNIIEDPKAIPHSFNHFIFDKLFKNIYCGKHGPLKKMVLVKQILYMQKLNPNTCLPLCRKTNLKWIKYLNVGTENFKHFQ